MSQSHGWLVRASVLARLLGIRLLHVEADITLAPTDVDPPRYAGPPVRAITVLTGDLRDAAELLARASRTLESR